MGGWVGGVEVLRIKPSQLSTKLKLELKLKLSLAKPKQIHEIPTFWEVMKIARDLPSVKLQR